MFLSRSLGLGYKYVSLAHSLGNKLPMAVRSISSTCSLCMPYQPPMVPQRWPKYNTVTYPPQELDEGPRPAFVCHMKTNVHYSPWKLWYIATLVRGMSIDEALKQLDYVKKKGVAIVKEALLEAQELAVKEHHVEFRSNLWIAESFVGKAFVIKGIRRHARARVGKVEYFYSHYFVRLEEGPPPKDFLKKEVDGPTLLQRWIQERRDQKIINSI